MSKKFNYTLNLGNNNVIKLVAESDTKAIAIAEKIAGDSFGLSRSRKESYGEPWLARYVPFTILVRVGGQVISAPIDPIDFIA